MAADLPLVGALLMRLPSATAMSIIFLATLVGGFMRGFTGFGAAMIIVPSVALVTMPRDAVVFHAVIEIPTALQLLPEGLRQARRATVLPMVLGLVLAVPAGMFLLVSLPAEVMRVVMSSAVLCLVAFMWAGRGLPPPRGNWAGILGGTAGGLLQGGAGVGGPPIAAALMARQDTPHETRGNVLVMMALIILVSIPMQFAFGLFTCEMLVLGVLMVPGYMAATFIGARYFRRNEGRSYRATAMLVLVLTALGTLLAALL